MSDVTRVGEWSPENVGGMWLDGATAPVVGARFKGTNRRGRTKWSTTCEVIAAAPGREFAFVTGTSIKPQTRWRYLSGRCRASGARLRAAQAVREPQ